LMMFQQQDSKLIENNFLLMIHATIIFYVILI
jgi:hypothetical protein